MTIQQFDVVEVAARMEFNGTDDVINVFQFQKVDAGGIPDANGIDDIIDILEVFYAILIGAQTVLQLYRDLRFSNKTQDTVLGTYPWKTLVAGTDALDPVAPGVCGLINFSTDVARVSPRKYMGVFTESGIISPGVWAPAITAGLINAGGALLGSLLDTYATWNYGFLSPKTSVFESVVSATATNVPAYQRRRKQGRGS